ncbi:ATP-binding protein [Streptomyces sp. WMMC500]|uniref:ATP-binding protein n=1 Tax=Streptomyces sp. WMMC500 TaxID=3015154 RepID=UPI00248B5516|nr:ATP-binding protein [Streptomyces sp. WMMC500]WBB58225.1 ATP-binding protein [Streptomyces sp. WMMC500]
MPENAPLTPATPEPAPAAASTARRAPAGRPGHQLAAGGVRSSLPAYTLGSPYALQSASAITHCPPPPPGLKEPSASHFAYGLTLPSATGTPVIAHDSAGAVLDVHGVEDELIDPALSLVHELAVHACRFTGAGELVHLVLRRSDGGALQVVAYDTHTPHLNSRLAGQCAERRRVSLAAVRELTEAGGGEWGFAASHPPAAGVCTWATIAHGVQGASGAAGVAHGEVA